jgi:hypothetical protein
MATYVLKGLRAFFEMPVPSKKSNNKMAYWLHLKLPQSLIFKKPENDYCPPLPLDLATIKQAQLKPIQKSKQSTLNLLLLLKKITTLLKLISRNATVITSQKPKDSNTFTPLITKLKPTNDGKDYA